MRQEFGTTKSTPRLTTGEMLIDVPASEAGRPTWASPVLLGENNRWGNRRGPDGWSGMLATATGGDADGRSGTDLTEPGSRRFGRSKPIASQQPDA